MSRVLPLSRWFLSTTILAGLLFLCAGTTGVPMLKAYLAVFAGTGLATAVLCSPTLDSERRKPGPEEIHHNSRRGTTALFLVTVIVAALDAGRFHWTSASSAQIQIVALCTLILAAGLQVWAMAANSFFSTAIRIQRDRGHKLIARGPYRFVRHPGYLAMMIATPATALALGSTLALIPGFCYSALILWRTAREDEFLVSQLVGYADYSARVSRRLIPGLW